MNILRNEKDSGRNTVKHFGRLPTGLSPNPWMDPNENNDIEELQYWLSFADWYQWKHLIYFDSWEDLYRKLESTTDEQLLEISRGMVSYFGELFANTTRVWQHSLKRILEGRRPSQNPIHQGSYEEAVKIQYGNHFAYVENE